MAQLSDAYAPKDNVQNASATTPSVRTPEVPDAFAPSLSAPNEFPSDPNNSIDNGRRNVNVKPGNIQIISTDSTHAINSTYVSVKRMSALFMNCSS